MVTRLRVFAANAAVMVLAGCGTTTGNPVAENGSTPPPTPVITATPPSRTTPTTTAPPSDQDQVRAAIKAFQDAANSQNWDAYLAAMCPAMRATFTAPIMEQVKTNRAADGITIVTVLGVTITGDTAKADLDSTNELIGSMQVSMTLARTEEGWKICM
ncbi:nuclear transport factor 2 family protein [Mycobacterium spongiae]|uniref:Nuclear transport factor 2 family protein n=2 Tax=Mycobacterium spongiae TaxID=886343 RepID=A0A975K237_9MYCO|nr:nuclear transport factor 2 family protein [Mycobacterium spongiae]